jgi:polyisoprenyl-phosphate glycosyltransferase
MVEHLGPGSIVPRAAARTPRDTRGATYHVFSMNDPVPQRTRSLSVVVPVYNEGPTVPELHRQLEEALARTGAPWELIYVDDGSTDGSGAALREIARADGRVAVLELSRNWGHQAALTAGLSEARGDGVVLIDGDLQDPPSVIPDLVRSWEAGAEVVVAERRSRHEPPGRALLFSLFYRALAFLSDYPIPVNAGIFGLLDRRAVDVLLRLTETNRYLPGLRAWVGFRTEVVSYDRAARAGGPPKQSVFRLFRYAFDAIFSFSYKPLRLSLLVGSFAAAFSLFYGVVLVVARLLGTGLFGIPVVDGYTSTIVSVLFLGGVQLIGIGILGEYVGRVYDEVKRRPLFVVRTVHRRDGGAPGA